MTTSRLEQAIQRYEAAITHLKTDPPKELSSAEVLDTLTARDEVQAALEDTTQTSGASLNAINQLDSVLKDNAGAIAKARETAERSAGWQTSFNPNEKAWWWFLTPPEPKRWSDGLDWFWNAASVTCLTISLALVGDISTRFLIGGPDTFGALAVSVQSVLTLLTAGGALTKAGQEAGKRFLSGTNCPERNWQEVGAIGSLALTSGLIALRLSLPQIANLYTHWGLSNYREGDLGSAEEQFKRALQLNPDDNEAHLWLGSLYEDLQNVDAARTQYQFAIEGGNFTAVNNLARQQILKGKYPEAAALLLKALDDEKKKPIDAETKHAILKNLGWTRLKQNDYAGAEAYLSDAIDLQKTAKLSRNTASPHCLLAQAREAQGDKKEALLEWEACNQDANSLNSDEDGWRITAQKRLTAKETHK